MVLFLKKRHSYPRSNSILLEKNKKLYRTRKLYLSTIFDRVTNYFESVVISISLKNRLHHLGVIIIDFKLVLSSFKDSLICDRSTKFFGVLTVSSLVSSAFT